MLGAQWGDEGKGKVVDMLATKMDIVCRCQVSKKKKILKTLLAQIYFGNNIKEILMRIVIEKKKSGYFQIEK